MPPRPTGSVYEKDGVIYIAVALPKRQKAHFPVLWASSKEEAEPRKEVVARIAWDLRRIGRVDLIRPVCGRATNAEEDKLLEIVLLVEGLVQGRESAPLVADRATVPQVSGSAVVWTVQSFGEYWTSNQLAADFSDSVKAIQQEDNVGRLRKHVYPLVFQGRRIGDLPLAEFTKEHARFITRQGTLPQGSKRHVGVILKRMFKLAADECEVIATNPLEKWKAPAKNPEKDGAYLYPSEDLRLMQCTDVPLVRRLLFGFAAREGIRRERIVNLRWSRVVLTGHGRKGTATVPGKPTKRPVDWVLDEGTAEALRRWMRLCPSKEYVFPAEALPRYRRGRAGKPLAVHQYANQLREALKRAGVTRPALFDPDEGFRRLVGHDLRATFVTLAKAAGESDAEIRRRTRHTSPGMIERYDHAVGIYTELNCGELTPLHEAIPELAEMEPSEEWRSASMT